MKNDFCIQSKVAIALTALATSSEASTSVGIFLLLPTSKPAATCDKMELGRDDLRRGCLSQDRS